MLRVLHIFAVPLASLPLELLPVVTCVIRVLCILRLKQALEPSDPKDARKGGPPVNMEDVLKETNPKEREEETGVLKKGKTDGASATREAAEEIDII